MIRICGFAFIDGQEQKMVSYTFNLIDDATGKIIKSNIRKSMVILDTNTNVLDAKTVIEDYITQKEST